MKFVYKQKTQKGGLYIPRNRIGDDVIQTGGIYHRNMGLPEELKRQTMDIAYGVKQRGGLGGFGNIGISQCLDDTRKKMRKKQRGGFFRGNGNSMLTQSLKDMREKMRKKQRGGFYTHGVTAGDKVLKQYSIQKGGSRAGGMGMFGYTHKRGTGWKPKKSKFAKKVTDYVRDVLQLEMLERQKAKAQAKGEKYNPFKNY